MGLLNAKPQSNKAPAEEQAKYTTLVKQVLSFIAEPETRQELQKLTETMGPEKALAAVISQALQMAGQAAKQAGAKVSTGTGMAALKEIVTVLVTMIASGGLIKDVDQSVQTVMQMVTGGGQPEQAAPMANPQEAMMEA